MKICQNKAILIPNTKTVRKSQTNFETNCEKQEKLSNKPRKICIERKMTTKKKFRSLRSRPCYYLPRTYCCDCIFLKILCVEIGFRHFCTSNGVKLKSPEPFANIGIKVPNNHLRDAYMETGYFEKKNNEIEQSDRTYC